MLASAGCGPIESPVPTDKRICGYCQTVEAGHVIYFAERSAKSEW